MEVLLCGPDGMAHVRRLPQRAPIGAKVEASGLTPGQTVVVEPVLGIVDGEPIEIAQ
jgi:hypothetical protein